MSARIAARSVAWSAISWGVLAAASAARAETAPHPSARLDPDEVYVDSLQLEGSLCQQGNFSYGFAPDASVITLRFADFRLLAPSGTPARAPSLACRLRLSLHVPPGFSFAVVAGDIVGSARLGKGAVATETIALRQGRHETPLLAHTMKGPLASEFRYRAVVAHEVWSPCSGRLLGDGLLPLDLTTELRLPTGPGQVFGVAVDGELRQRLKLSWRPCDPRH